MSDALSDAVRMENVSRSFGTQRVVDGLSFRVPEGSLFGLIGPNGSGKTTTMRMILRIYRPDEGRVVVLGQSEGRATDTRVGYLPEERGLYPRMTVRGTLKYFARLKRVANPVATIDHWLEALQATQWAHKRVDQLSKGMAQKVQFIASVIGRPRLVILDEPFSGLDPVNLEVLREAVHQLRADGATVILSTHDMEVAQGMCDEVMMIHRGRKVLEGPPAEIRRRRGQPRLRVRLAGGAPPPEPLHGVSHRAAAGEYFDLTLESLDVRAQVLEALALAGDIEHFETIRPSLHDIFVSIARDSAPEAADQGDHTCAPC